MFILFLVFPRYIATRNHECVFLGCIHQTEARERGKIGVNVLIILEAWGIAPILQQVWSIKFNTEFLLEFD